jgi:hypothetical protein
MYVETKDGAIQKWKCENRKLKVELTFRRGKKGMIGACSLSNRYGFHKANTHDHNFQRISPIFGGKMSFKNQIYDAYFA